MLTICLVLPIACAGHPSVIVIPADRMIRKLPDGNYEVTPAWMLDTLESLNYWKNEAQKNK